MTCLGKCKGIALLAISLYQSVSAVVSRASTRLGSDSSDLWALQERKTDIGEYGCVPPLDLPSLSRPVTDVIVVLGGPTNGTEPGPWLEWRLKAALKLYQKHSSESTAFMLTGGHPKSYGSCAARSEASIMQRWLEKAGISQGVWREDQSNNTLDNAERSWLRLSGLQKRSLLASNVTVHIVTQDWHMEKAKECFNVFFNGGGFHPRYNSLEGMGLTDDSMGSFEQESYADMYRMQLKNWLPWQLGFHRVATTNSEVTSLIDEYVAHHVHGASENPFFKSGASSASESLGSPAAAWSHINDLQFDIFLASLRSDLSTSNDFVTRNAFSTWGSLSCNHCPRYVTAFNPGHDSGQLLGLSCPGKCGKLYDALRVITFLQRPSSRNAQLKVLELAEKWAQAEERYSPSAVASFVLRQVSSSGKISEEAQRSLRGWSGSLFSKQPGSGAIEALAAKPC